MDTDPKTKRRLPIVSSATDASDKKLMTEVLPDPTRTAGPGSPRQRTLERMTRLMAIAAATTAIQAKCGAHTGVVPQDAAADTQSGYMVVDELPRPAVVPVTDAQTPPTPPGGYGVVDPMPPPYVRHPPPGSRRGRR